MAAKYRLEADVAVLEIDNPPVNALSLPVRAQLVAGIRRAAADGAVKGIVICARGSFSAGADIKEIANGLTFAPPILLDVQAEIESAGKPIVAAIDGSALGGGLELALTCHARVASPGAKMGLPEVKLGLIPGAGGTQRFTRLAGPEAALEAITTGAHLPAARALALGLIDAVAADPLAAALALARSLASAGAPLSLASERADKIAAADRRLISAWREKIAKEYRGQLAPLRVCDAIEAALTRERAEAFKLEREYYLECRESPQRKALMHVFQAERAAGKIPGVGPEVKPQPIRRAAVIGAGTMGGGIAMCFATAGIPVTLLDVSGEALERGLAGIRARYASSVARGRLTREKVESALSLIDTATDYEALANVDIAIEAVFEDATLKREIFGKLDRHAPAHAVLATNTSSLDIDMIAAATARPQQVLGTHFFSPAHVMKLMENVRGAHTSPHTLATVMALARTLGKIPVLAGNCDGFIGNRMLQYYGAEAERLLEEGATPEQVDRVIEAFGFAMGPLAMRDLAGNDVGWAIRRNRTLPPDERWSPILQRMAEEGRLGQKSGRGFYRYEGRTRRTDPQALALIERVSRELGIERRQISDEEILRRLLHPLVNEGAKILEERIALRAGDIDIVYIYGYGFPAYKGGPMFWAQQAGLGEVVKTMEELAPSHGHRWLPAKGLMQAAEKGEWTA
jgi:3-hydroxyacyl-CoA dehydrogenase